jgi:DNA-binding transcriptional ArsR family regulator
MVKQSESLDRCFAALADPTRRQIVEQLARGGVSVTNLAARRRMTVAAVLKHLTVLESAGLIRTRKQGRVRECALTPQPMRKLANWLDLYRSLWETRLDALEQLLKHDKGARS